MSWKDYSAITRVHATMFVFLNLSCAMFACQVYIVAFANSNIPLVCKIWSITIFLSHIAKQHLKFPPFWRILHWRLLHDHKKRWHYFRSSKHLICQLVSLLRIEMPPCSIPDPMTHIMQHNYQNEMRMLIFSGMHWCELTSVGPFLIILLSAYVKLQVIFCILHKRLQQAWYGSAPISPQNIQPWCQVTNCLFYFCSLDLAKSCCPYERIEVT